MQGLTEQVCTNVVEAQSQIKEGHKAKYAGVDNPALKKCQSHSM